MTNFKSQLTSRDLKLGHSSKRERNELAGMHGEGFKLAALVFCRKGFKLKYEASGFRWNFKLGKKDFRCNVRAPKAGLIDEKKRKFERVAHRTRGLTSNIWEDVTLLIKTGSASPISEQAFRSWLKVTIDIDGPAPEDLIRTARGEFILGKEFAHRVYLKGLWLASQSASGRTYELGYNFYEGQVNRDREIMANDIEESYLVAGILEEAMLEDTLRGRAVAERYVNLFLDNPKCGETLWAEHTVSRRAANRLWTSLKTDRPNVFFYFTEHDVGVDNDDPVHVITSVLQKEALQLDETLWKILRTYKLVRTPQEQRVHMFKTSTVIALGANPFGTGVFRAFQAALQASPRTAGLRVEIVQSEDFEIDLLFDAQSKVLSIHQKWFDFAAIHTEFKCELFCLESQEQPEPDLFLCDHVVEDLIELALNDVRAPLKLQASEYSGLRRMSRKRIRQMPRQIRLLPTERPGELQVTWAGNESGIFSARYGNDIKYVVAVHEEEKCSCKSTELVYTMRDEAELPSDAAPVNGLMSRTGSLRADCGCPQQVVAGRDTRAIFNGLDESKRYFALVARAENMSFFGLPTMSLTPVPLRGPAASADSSNAVRAGATAHAVTPNAHDSASDLDTDDLADHWGMLIDAPVTSSGSEPTSAANDTREERRANDIVSTAKLQDENAWKAWGNNEPPHILTRNIPGRGTEAPSNSTTTWWASSLLKHRFDVGKASCVRISGQDLVIVPHIFYHHESRPTKSAFNLLVTKYTNLRTSIFVDCDEVGDQDTAVDGQELLLHFTNIEQMGTPQDAEIINTSDIETATSLRTASGKLCDRPKHVWRALPAEDDRAPFCRFAIGNDRGSEQMFVTPLTSKLLAKEDQWKPRKFLSTHLPAVLDLSPDVLGPSEGFSKAHCQIHAAVGFAEDRHLTWKIRYPTSQVIDGLHEKIFAENPKSSLEVLPALSSSTPRVAVIAARHAYFRFKETNTAMATLEEFLRPLTVLSSAVDSLLDMDFFVALLSPASLHPSAVHKLRALILQLLNQRMTVHMKLLPVRNCGLPQARSVLVLVASRVCASLRWPSLPPTPDTDAIENVMARITDLVFKNTRSDEEQGSAFVCPLSTEPSESVHNHQTGRADELRGTPLDAQAQTVELSPNGKLPTHLVRGDLLTVRELARLQGFDDDFVFYHSRETQYTDVLSAVPPVVAQRVAEAIRDVIRRTGRASEDVSETQRRLQKRVRIE